MADTLTFDDLIPEDQRPKEGLINRVINFYRQPVEEKETAPGRMEPPPVGSDPMGDSAGLAIMRDAPMPEKVPERVRDSSVVADQPYNDGKGNEGDPLRDLGLGAANAAGGNVFGDFYDPTGSNVVAGQFASKALTPFTMAGAKGMAGAVGDAARGIDVLVGLGTNGQTQFDWAKDLADWGSAQAKLVRGEVNSLKDVQGIGDFGTYLVERFGEGFGAFAPFFFGGPATAVGIGAVQGIGSTYNSLMEDKGIQDKLKSGELTEQDVRKISMIGGVVNGLVMGGVVKTVGRQSEFTKNFGRDLTRLALIDPGVFALSGGITTAANELLAGYFGGNAEVDERVARTLDATINGFFGGLPFGAAKVGGRIEARAQERAATPPSQPLQTIPENGVAQETAAALSKDAGTAAASSDVDPTIQAATQADIRARVKAAADKVREQAAAEEAVKSELETKLKAAQEAPPKFGRGSDTKEARDFLVSLPDGAKLYDKVDGTTYVVTKLDDVKGSLLRPGRTNRVQIEREDPDGGRAFVYRLMDSSRPKGIVLKEGKFDFNRVQLEPVKETAKAADDEKIKAGIEATKPKTNFADTAIERLTKKGVELTDEQAAEVRARVEQGRTEGKKFGEILDGLYQDYGAAPKDAGVTIPEGAPTLEIQLKDLADKNRNVMLFPSEGGKPADTSVAGERPKGVFEVVKPEGTYWYRTGRGGTSKEKIEAARKDPKALADLLGYGPSKEEVAATKKPDETPLAAVERTDDGVEVKAAATNETLAPQTLEAVEANKGAPDRTVTLEPESNVIAGREAGTGKAPEAEAAAPAPAGAGPKAAPVVVRLKSRARKDKAPEAPKPEATVTPEVTPEPQKPQGRVLRIAEQEAELERQRANADRGMRITTEGDNRDFGVAPDTSDVKARNRFIRRAVAAVKTMGDAAPQYYKDAAEAKAAQTKGRSAANMERTSKIDAAWQQEHEANLSVIERRKAAEEEAAKAADAPEPEPDGPVYEPKREYTDEQIQRVIDEIAAMIPREKARAEFLATDPAKLRELAALELDRRKSDLSGGQSDVNDLKNAISLDENRTAMRDDDVVDTYAKLKGEPVSIFDRLMARYEAAGAESAKLAERLNAMTDEKFKNWIMRAEKREFLEALRAADEHGITRLKTDEFRRLIDEIANEPIYPSRETTVKELFDENKLAPKDPNEKQSVRDQLSAFIERRIMSLVGDMKVMVVDNDTIKRANIQSGRSDKIGGSYDPIKNHILLNEDYYVPGTAEGRALLVHEALHGVLANTMRRNKALAEQITKLRDFVEEQIQNNPELRAEFEGLDIKYGLKNADEFISETWSNRDFQDLLSRIEINDAQLRAMKINPAQGWVRDGFRAMVELVRQALGTTPNTRSALEEAIRYTDAAFEKREALGEGASKSAMTPDELARAEAARPLRPIKLDDYAAKRGPEQVIRRELENAGVPRSEAEEMVKALREELGEGFTFKNAKPIIDELVSDYKSYQNAPPPKSDAQVKAGLDEVAQNFSESIGFFVPKGKVRAPNRVFLKMAANNEIAQAADKVFGRETNPLREVYRLLQKQGAAADEFLTRYQKAFDELSAARGKFKDSFDDMMSLLNDSSVAQVYPDVALADPKNAHLGKDALKGMWGKAQHAELASRYAKLDPELKKHFNTMLELVRDARERAVIERPIAAILRAKGINDEALVQRFVQKKATAQDKEQVGESALRSIDKVIETVAMKGPYAPFMREGDFVVNARIPVEPPSPDQARKISDNTFDFTSRKDAIAWAQKQKLRTEIDPIRIDPKTGETFFVDDDGKQVRATKKDFDAEQRFRVTVQNQHTEFFRREADAKKKAKELREMGAQVRDVEPVKDMGRANRTASIEAQRLMATLDKRKNTSDLTPQQLNEIKGVLNEFALQISGTNRIQSNLLPRRYVQGMSQDVLKSVSEYMVRAANYTARVDYADAIAKAMKEAGARVDRLSELGTGNGGEARKLVNEMQSRVDFAQDYTPPGMFERGIRRVMSAAFSAYLGSLSYSINNFTQRFNTWGELSGDHGFTRAMIAIKKADLDMGTARILASGVADTGRALKGSDARAPMLEMIKARETINAREREMLDRLAEVRTIDPDAGFDIASLRRSESPSTFFRGVDNVLGYSSEVVRALPRAVEMVNRVGAALAAYRLEYRRNGGDHEAAIRYAEDTVNNTQFNQSPSNLPPVVKDPKFAMTLQFKNYLFRSMHMVGRQIGRAYRNESPGERLKAVRALVAYNAGYIALGGVLGMAGMEIPKLALLLANALGFTEFKPSDFEYMIREQLTKLLGKSGGEIASRGLTRAIPGGFAVDTSNRLGFPTFVFGEPRGDKETDTKAWLFDFVAGAGGSLVFRLAKSVRLLQDGKTNEALENLIPVKQITDTLRSGRQFVEGKKDQAGRQTLSEYTPQEAFVRALGYTPAREAERSEERAAIGGALADYNKQRQKLIQDWIANPNNRAKAMIAIEKFNRDKPKDAQIDMKDLRSAEKRRKTDDANRAETKGLRTNKRNDYLIERRDIYNTGN